MTLLKEAKNFKGTWIIELGLYLEAIHSFKPYSFYCYLYENSSAESTGTTRAEACARTADTTRKESTATAANRSSTDPWASH